MEREQSRLKTYLLKLLRLHKGETKNGNKLFEKYPEPETYTGWTYRYTYEKVDIGKEYYIVRWAHGTCEGYDDNGEAMTVPCYFVDGYYAYDDRQIRNSAWLLIDGGV